MIIETVIDRPATGGEFIARHEGRILFVTGGITGERVRVSIADPKAKLWRAQVVDVFESSPLRVNSTCAAANKGAGCCDWDYIDRAQAVELKRDVLVDCLTRLGGYEGDSLPDISLSTLTPTEGWRNRVRLGVDKLGRAGLRAAHSNALVLGAACCQNVAGLTDGVDCEGFVPLQDAIQAQRRRVRHANPGELHIVMDSSGNRNVVHVQGRGRNRRERILEGAGVYTEHVGDVEFEVPVTGFWQAHTAAVSHYLSVIKALLPQSPGAVAWDLYGGVGVFALALAEVVGEAGKVVSVEAFPQAAQSGRYSLRDYPVEFRTGDVTKTVQALVREQSDLSSPEFVVLDPPRAGAGASAIKAIANAHPARVVHIGCDPATFARDAKAWAELGYRLQSLEVVDAFPGTHHLETIALFVRG